jgi:hypothetical protein
MGYNGVMRFPASFQRRVGGVAPPAILGSDVAPTVAPTLPITIDNQFNGQMLSPQRSPAAQYIMILCSVTVGNVPPLPADIYAWDARSASWFIVNKSRIQIRPGRMVAIPAPALNFAAGSGDTNAIQLALVVNPLGAPFAPPDGIYTFSWGIGVGGANAKTTYNLSPVVAVANAGTILAEAGAVSSVLVCNPTETAGWLQFFDKGVPAVNGDTPFTRVWVPAGATFTVSFADENEEPIELSSGLVWAASTTDGTLTIDAGATYGVQARFS